MLARISVRRHSPWWLLLALVATPLHGLARDEAATWGTTDITRLQIFLDNHHFSPGAIDGRFGTFTKRALSYYRTRQDQAGRSVSSICAQARREIPHVFVTHRVKASEMACIGKLPTSIAQQAALSNLPYASLEEFLAERYHVSPEFLRRINPARRLDALQAGDLVIVPNVKEVFRIESVSSLQRTAKASRASKPYIYIDTAQRMASLYHSTTILAAFPITHGRPQFVPRGKWEVVNMIVLPSFRWDERMLKQGKRSRQSHLLPPGPNNPVGVFWAGLNKKGIGLHGTNNPETIGRSHSAGCIRFANWDAVRLPQYLQPGSEVIIR